MESKPDATACTSSSAVWIILAESVSFPGGKLKVIDSQGLMRGNSLSMHNFSAVGSR